MGKMVANREGSAVKLNTFPGKPACDFPLKRPIEEGSVGKQTTVRAAIQYAIRESIPKWREPGYVLPQETDEHTPCQEISYLAGARNIPKNGCASSPRMAIRCQA